MGRDPLPSAGIADSQSAKTTGVGGEQRGYDGNKKIRGRKRVGLPAPAGVTVWLGSRDQERGESAAKDLADEGDVRFVGLDVTDEQSVGAAAARVGDETGALDVLVNNAGVAIAEGEALPSTVRPETIQRAFDVNFYGALRVTQAFLPLVRTARAGRIVNVSSTLGSITTLVSPANPFGHGRFPIFAYPASKTLLNALTGWLAVELKDTPIKVKLGVPRVQLHGYGQQPGSAASIGGREGRRARGHARGGRS